MESISQASRLEGDRASINCVHASIGINRLWVYAKYRREGVATSLLDAIRYVGVTLAMKLGIKFVLWMCRPTSGRNQTIWFYVRLVFALAPDSQLLALCFAIG